MPPHHDHHAAASCARPKGSSSTPAVARHILHVVADDLGYHDIGYHNAARSSPNLDRLRACGVHLDQFYAFKACAPSRASLLSGRYPFRIGVYQNADIDAGGVPSNFTFLPELLRRAGFATHVRRRGILRSVHAISFSLRTRTRPLRSSASGTSAGARRR